MKPETPPVASSWCCVQSGHREHYAIPRALHHAGLLGRLITDVWVPPGSALARLARGRLGARLRDRYHPDLPRRLVSAMAGRALTWEVAARTRGLRGDELVLAHNAWWAARTTAGLRRLPGPGLTHVFSYCYEARSLFAEARARGLVPVLGQIDPGPEQDRRSTELARQWADYQTPFQPGTAAYYESWREECRLAGHILVNSSWSRDCLVRTGVEARKIQVCPLIYTPPAESVGWRRTFVREFTRQRPLRVLFLGRCVLLKGVAETIEAARQLKDSPVEFTFVGNTDIRDFSRHFGGARIRHVPRVSRAECHAFYREADVFLFPTHSDGFGLTQLEAQAWRLPIIASPFCAEVVRPGVSGWVLPAVTADRIRQVIEDILLEPAALARCSEGITPWSFSRDDLARVLAAISVTDPAVAS